MREEGARIEEINLFIETYFCLIIFVQDCSLERVGRIGTSPLWFCELVAPEETTVDTVLALCIYNCL